MGKNLSLIISAGKGCFTACKGCYQYFGKGLMSTDEIIDFIKKYKNRFNLEKVTLAGGDPLTREDIIHLVNEIYGLGVKINLDTVGKTLIKDSKMIFHGNELVKKINIEDLCGKINMLGIPLDGHTTTQINKFRTMITLKEILEILNFLENYNIDICINTVVNQNNLNDLDKIYLIIKNFNNIKKWQLFQYSPTGELGYQNKELFEIDKTAFDKSIKELLNKIDASNEIQIQAKSNDLRKCAYILINTEGMIWYPKVNINKKYFCDEDESPDNKIIGSIYDVDILDKIENEFRMIKK